MIDLKELVSSGDRLQLVVYALIGAILVNFTVNFLYDKYQARRLGCKPPVFLRLDYCFGFKTLIDILKAKKEGTLIDVNRERFEQEGRGHLSTFEMRLAGIMLKSTRDPENIKAILATQFNDFALGTRHAAFLPLLGDGIFTLDGTGWKHSRALLRPQFAREQVAHVRALEPHILRFAKHVKLHQGGKFDIQELFFRLTVDSATEFLFGESVESLKDSAIGESYDAIDFDGKSKFAEAFNLSQAYLATRAVSLRLNFLVNNKEFRDSNAIVHKFADHYVDKALNTDTKELEEHSKNGYIFLYELVQQTRDRKVLRDQLLNILVAGRDTTAGLLSFTFYELSRNPTIWEKLKAELYEAFGSGDDSNVNEITFESLKKCEYLKAVLNETLRMYPSVPQNFRISTKPTSLPRGGGPDGLSPVYIPKGTMVSYAVYATHRNKNVYGKDANDFRPERWFEPSTKKLGWNFVPFNGGPRICLGQQFALTEASYVVTRLAQLFPNLQSMDDEPYPPTKNSQLTMCLNNGAWIALW